MTLWPSGQAQPGASTLNAFDGAVVANAAIVQAGTVGANWAVNAYATDRTDLILDANGFFGPGGNPGELRFFPLIPCRVTDTRASGAPLRAGETREFAVGSSCSVPSGAKAYALNVTAVPAGPLAFLTLWPFGTNRPLVSTLNSTPGRVVANAALVPAGLNATISAFTPNETHLILDINGYFQ